MDLFQTGAEQGKQGIIRHVMRAGSIKGMPEVNQKENWKKIQKQKEQRGKNPSRNNVQNFEDMLIHKIRMGCVVM